MPLGKNFPSRRFQAQQARSKNTPATGTGIILQYGFLLMEKYPAVAFLPPFSVPASSKCQPAKSDPDS